MNPPDRAAQSLLPMTLTESAAEPGIDVLFAEAQRLHRAGNPEEAARLHGRILAQQPDHPRSTHFLGIIEAQRGNTARGVALLQRSLELDPGNPTLLTNCGVILAAIGRPAEALAAYDRALAANPDFVEAHRRRALLLSQQGAAAEALAASARALAAAPEDPRVQASHAGLLVQIRGPSEEAADLLRRAAAREPGNHETQASLAGTLVMLGHEDEARAAIDRALALRPDEPNARLARALMRLRGAELAGGWEDYAHRWRTERFRALRRHADRPDWTGQPLGESTILLWGEQGLAEEILFAGMVPEVQRRARRVLIECDPRLVPLFRRSWPGAVVTGRGDEALVPETVHFQASTLGAAALLRPGLESFAQTAAGYLKPDPLRRNRIRARHDRLGARMRVGIARAASSDALPLAAVAAAQWARILDLPGAAFFDLQPGSAPAPVQSGSSTEVTLHREPGLDLAQDLDGAAALIAALDLVVAANGPTAHLAAAVGVPVWLLTPSGPGSVWYWFAGREDSPWYPTMRLFRQTPGGDWDPAIEAAASALAQRIRATRADWPPR